MKLKQILYTPMTGLGQFVNSNEWLENRINIFQEWTLKSLKNQKQGFIHLVSFTEKEEYNSHVYKLWVDEMNYPLRFSLNGLLYHDDRFEDENPKNRNLVKRLECLEALKEDCKDADWIYFTRIDSDDLFCKDAFKEIMEQKPEKGVAFIFQKGYIYNKETDEMAEWNPTTCPPFYTMCFPKETFFDPRKHFNYVKGWRSHEDTVKILKPVYLSDRKYCVVVHGNNTSTTWGHRFKGKKVNKKLLNNFI